MRISDTEDKNWWCQGSGELFTGGGQSFLNISSGKKPRQCPTGTVLGAVQVTSYSNSQCTPSYQWYLHFKDEESEVQES
jgi:hypothetical protein